MSQRPIDELLRELEDQSRLVRGLHAAILESLAIPPDDSLLDSLAEAEASLRNIEGEYAARRAERQPGAGEPSRAMGLLLGPETTGLRVETMVRLKPVPTGIYHLLDPETDPLLTVSITNESFEWRRVCVSAHIEGLSARAIKTVELRPGDREPKVIPMLPSLLPEQARRIVQVQRATLQVRVEIFASIEDARTRNPNWSSLIESHDTHSLLMLARTSSFNSVADPSTGTRRDLSKYYGAWVTPHIEPVQAIVRKAAEKLAGRRIWGYQGERDPEATAAQVRALFDTLAQEGIAYVNSIIDFGAGPGQATQRTRLPRESLRQKAANCIDGTVLFASLLECASLHAGLVLIPGHAFVAWETSRGSRTWDYLETTMISDGDFEAARDRARSLFACFFDPARLRPDDPTGPRLLDLNTLRAQGIWPME
ncbi:hypothetical protein OJF2_10190 [Aquisphaera giovannonii]|uniref:Uncharacterized protein n=1 Tax=Aquisphaera giovannonii TaxID=406548 RepID=A0A5B9VWD7_9BACT|nr:hypothetical protein [Aquisphaera giovannonii]QEH32542.1 hypothetical protein OJF2_10190 [Aquisphaera giovannonii]